MRCEIKVIYNNPKYRIIKYHNEYLIVDLASTWLAFIFPMINWLIPKKYAKISQEEFEKLTIVQPNKNKAFWPTMAGVTMCSVTFRKHLHLLDFQLEQSLIITICVITFLGILIFYFYLNKRLTIDYFKARSQHKGKIMLFPNFKHACSILLAYICLAGVSILCLTALITVKPQNIIIFALWIVTTMLFFLAGMVAIGYEKVHVISKTEEVDDMVKSVKTSDVD
ncbi:DUF443 family protein [Staphylococcus ratti]|uniref:DUF443 domain-containing protein n=1 Tax=Staphylococcus ratti TaxID=2892440 RepID=A0ABY3PEZ4_9STAP|nr:DUF443 family protein [Staphylococcus ratti]UEX90903.1 DUF443 domain-containing protein [Staphylococcus ratti]